MVKRRSGREKDTEGGLVVPMIVGSPEGGEKRVGTVEEQQQDSEGVKSPSIHEVFIQEG